ncbi:MAG: hypothetical protein KY462_08915 [Actinobacteria bacterium]|nr:hypothetical protein [Actinomycetota bacterium]
MSADDFGRARLWAHLEERLGVDVAEVLLGEFGGIRSRLDGVESRLVGVESRLDGVESRLNGVERTLGRMDERFDSMRYELKSTLHEELRGIQKEMKSDTRLLFFSILGSNATLASLAFAAARFA